VCNRKKESHNIIFPVEIKVKSAGRQNPLFFDRLQVSLGLFLAPKSGG